ncbi:ral guanine nucleotide dissociation stimulator-like [Thomomys bottae]
MRRPRPDKAPSQDEGCRAGTLPQLVEHLVPAQLTGEHFFIPTFLSTYRKFTSTEQVLDLLFQTAISSILDMWLDEYGEDFCQPAHFACLKQLLAHLKRHMTGTHVESRDNCSWVRWRPKSQARHSLMVWKLGGKTEERGGMNVGHNRVERL